MLEDDMQCRNEEIHLPNIYPIPASQNHLDMEMDNFFEQREGTITGKREGTIIKQISGQLLPQNFSRIHTNLNFDEKYEKYDPRKVLYQLRKYQSKHSKNEI